MAVEDTAREILQEVGGKENIENLTHCATRLRFTLKDATSIDKAKVDKIDGVLAAVPQTDTSYQIVIGGGVAAVFDEINAQMKADKGGKKKTAPKPKKQEEMTDAEVKEANRSKRGGGKYLNAFFEYLADSFRPILGVLLAASLVCAGLNLCISLGVIKSDIDNPTVMFFKAICQGVFYFLPIMIAYNAGKKLRIDPWVSAMVVMILMTPQFVNLCTADAAVWKDSLLGAVKPEVAQAITSSMGEVHIEILGKTFTYSTVFGLPMLVYDYSGNVFVPLITTPIVALIYKGFQKIIPSSVHLVFVPTFTVLIGTFIAAFITGPLGVLIGSLLGVGLQWLYTTVPFIFMIAIPLVYPFLVPVGLHWPLNALMLMNISQLGYDFIQGPMGVWNFACFGTTLGVMLIAIAGKDKNMRSTAGGALAAGLLGGVSEPSLYGIHLRFKGTYRALLTGCLAGGIVIAVLGFMFPSTITTPEGVSQTVSGVTTTGFAFSSLLTIPMFNQMWVYGISIAVAFAVSVIMVLVFDYRTPEEKAKQRALAAAERLGVVGIDDFLEYGYDLPGVKAATQGGKMLTFKAPIEGTTLSLKETRDPAFAMKALGEGIAVNPKEGVSDVTAPISGVVKDVAKSKHAITLEGKFGGIFLVHIGIDTVSLDGKYFDVKVEKGDEVAVGDVLVKADFEEIKKAGCKPYVVTTVVNSTLAEDIKIKPIESGVEVVPADDIGSTLF